MNFLQLLILHLNEETNCIKLCRNGTSFWGKETKEALGYSQESIKTAVNQVIQICYLKVGSFGMQQSIGIPMGIDPALF